VSQSNLPEKDHIVRYVPWTKVDKDADDNVRGILAIAYERREDEDGLSVNWLEMAGEIQTEAALRKTLNLIGANMTVGKKARLAVSNVQKFKEVCADRDKKVRIVHAPINGNEPHSEVRKIPRNDLRLLEDLSTIALLSHHCCGDLMD
jgi:hypothetical protein